MIQIFFILQIIVTPLSFASFLETLSVEQIKEKFNSPGSNFIELYDILREIWANGHPSAPFIDIFTKLTAKFLNSFYNFIASHPPSVTLRQLNHPSRDLGLLVCYLYRWLGTSTMPSLNLSLFLYDENSCQVNWTFALRKDSWISLTFETLIARIQILAQIDPCQESLEEIRNLISSFEILRQHQIALQSRHYPARFTQINPLYPYLIQFYKSNLTNLHQIASLDLCAELYSVTMAILHSFKGMNSLDNGKLQKVIYLNFLVRKLYYQYASDFSLIIWDSSTEGPSLSIEQFILIFMCHQNSKDAIRMYHFICEFLHSDQSSKSMVNILIISLVDRSKEQIVKFHLKDQIKIKDFLKRLRRFYLGRKWVDYFLNIGN
jgi:hypothetical protein